MSLTEELKAVDPLDRSPEYAEGDPDLRAVIEQAGEALREANAEIERLRRENERLRLRIPSTSYTQPRRQGWGQ